MENTNFSREDVGERSFDDHIGRQPDHDLGDQVDRQGSDKLNDQFYRQSDDEAGHFGSSGGLMDRREAIKKTLIAIVAGAATMLPQDVFGKDTKDKEKLEREKVRKEMYDLVEQIGLIMIKDRESYTLQFYVPGKGTLYSILKLRFRGKNESAIFYESWLEGDLKPYEVERYAVDDYKNLLEMNYKNGWDVFQV